MNTIRHFSFMTLGFYIITVQKIVKTCAKLIFDNSFQCYLNWTKVSIDYGPYGMFDVGHALNETQYMNFWFA